MIMFALVAIVMIIAGGLAIRQLLRWQRSNWLNWSSQLHRTEQARICGIFFRRNGVRATVLRGELPLIDLELFLAPSRVLVSFGDLDLGLNETYLRDMQEMQLITEVLSILVVVVPNDTNLAGLYYAEDCRVPILYRHQLHEVSRLLVSTSPKLRQSLLALSAANIAGRGRVPRNVVQIRDKLAV